MSTIERVAKLLAPIERANAKSTETSDLDVSERPPSETIERTGLQERGEFAARLEIKDLAVESRGPERSLKPTSKTTHRIEVDRDRLRRQSMITPEGQRTPNAESFRRVKRQILTNVAKAKSRGPSNLVMVTSSVPGEGKTFCAINLAISIALEMNRTVLLVDADVAKPSIPNALGMKADRGLLDALLDREIDLAELLWSTDIGRLTLLPAGTAHQHATELLASDAMRSLLTEMAERYGDRIIIFDSPPLLAASEAAVLASQMAQIVMVVEAGKTSEATLTAALGRVDRSNITGLLLNKSEGPKLGEFYGEYG